MKTYSISIVLVFFSVCCNAQTITQKIEKVVKLLQQDTQMKHAIMSLYVVETKTGKPVYALNEQVGLAPASTQKLFTSVAAFELLGKDFRYKTEVGYDSIIENGALKGNLYITGYGDPTLGSWRYAQTKRDSVLNKILIALNKAGIKKIDGDVIMDDSKFSYQPLPGGWIWDDIGNYYGAGTWAINWNENQYDLLLKPGNKAGDDVTIIGTQPLLADISMSNLLKSGKPGSGDNGYIYMAPYSTEGFVSGSVPAGEKSFTLSGALSYPALQFGKELLSFLTTQKINTTSHVKTSHDFAINNMTVYAKQLTTLYSPALDSITYWFLQKSINLYGEALIKTMAYQNNSIASTDKGVELLKDFWSKNGIEKSALNIVDGSGLSPQNRVTTKALVTALQYAKDKNWYSSFYNALPMYNGMHMKSGTIGGAKAYAGYHTSKSGVGYTFAIMINNFDEAGGNIVPKMYKVLDELK
ncbi:D-alanyl-D-alanine carboxypeptidase/D-alanyl-D-alanine endopeptidase [Panacibacter ginsenosidivorans]|nr:D-alanyl-D-alanine carboxypeptidase/D-alanyl-D-alanine-endopeptidase [Panacibacter ginsenosidivorans]